MRGRIFTPVVAGMLLMTGVMLANSACSHEHHRAGPAERAGAKVDRAADKTGDVIEDTGKKVNRALPGD